jgi:hypothetical protein
LGIIIALSLQVSLKEVVDSLGEIKTLCCDAGEQRSVHVLLGAFSLWRHD